MARIAESISQLKIVNEAVSKCSLHRDSRIFSDNHVFCDVCSERSYRKLDGSDPCPMCRPFFTIPDDGFDGHPRDYFTQNLDDLHNLYIDRVLEIPGEKVFDTPLVEQFKVRRVTGKEMSLTWLANKIYVIYYNIKRIRVFSGQAPFNELPEAIELKGARFLWTIVADKASRSLFISDKDENCIWKIQLSKRRVTRWDIDVSPENLSITPDDELLVVAERTEFHSDWVLCVDSLTDGSLIKSIDLSRDIFDVVCAAQLPDQNIVISYTKRGDVNHQLIGILSRNNEVFIRHLDLKLFKSITDKLWCPYYFAVTDDGQIFVADIATDRIILFNSQMTDYKIISYNGTRLSGSPMLIYVKEKRQLLVTASVDVQARGSYVSVFHLDTCNATEEKCRFEEDHKLRVNKKRFTFDFSQPNIKESQRNLRIAVDLNVDVHGLLNDFC